MLSALDFYLGPVDEIAIVGDPEVSDTRETLRLLRQAFRPCQVLAFKPAGADEPSATGPVPLLTGKTAQGAVTVYVCRDFACQAPLVGLEALRSYLQEEAGKTV
jgi:uncharacterized protein YyaL (SSP411 family)